MPPPKENGREREEDRDLSEFTVRVRARSLARAPLSLFAAVPHLVVTNFPSLDFFFFFIQPSESTPTPDFLLTHLLLPSVVQLPRPSFLPSAFVSAAKLSEFLTVAATSQSESAERRSEGFCTFDSIRGVVVKIIGSRSKV